MGLPSAKNTTEVTAEQIPPMNFTKFVHVQVMITTPQPTKS